MKLALFDLDHTLLPLDSDYSWGGFTATLGWTDAEAFNRRNDAFYAQYKAGTMDIHEYVRFATEAVKAKGEAAALAAHARFMAEVIRPAMRESALALLDSHRQAGDQLVMVTATNEFVTRPIAGAFGVAELIAVDLMRDNTLGGTGWITGEIRGTPSFREGKVTRVEHWLAQRDLSWSSVHSCFYSDSINDLPLLEKVNEPVATNPDPALRDIASRRGWRILELFP